ncbi:FAD-dependent monooxygenase [Bradyrhizobium sp. U87765 SZCCT0131]|uniref:FAD-dependent oxidoreductase n=1 Tax=unclassified Bradyrhizobium TaxID=2631580 RepID=UPI001BAC8E6B|nr:MULTISPECIES: NAD(P)/FAD-dependent oxidoreductase [unclassified Bradyrhizobium]MBR1223085.1 FAD-dependent monooxygenase [Bradyrhizobium sp. U87765 SZCCT0131]MBR1265869.1 FAD-dependent monooxygenase [Bradyrhizobium sp. U87765 SZCCT0134]MBR1308707.1 FAD-dependent monooxygenase [Bradyrhizobium sp. U87765 SZCCT0110]MBR1318603.1 FAD-dependent monooxygenase [Bradyrhizobium sp. U87765 SZCCT0109]MBR1352307.1 FAD-dependent monooxygenase [Bradyrhizobium sp. U87765 SZCCT0048]
MHQVDVAIIGGGLAGSTAAAMLGRAGVKTALIDPHTVYPQDFRCEKIDGPQLDTLRRIGLIDDVMPAMTYDRQVWIARLGRLIDRRRGDQYGFAYETLVQAARGAVPSTVTFVAAKATAISTSDDTQQVTLSNGDTVTARLVVLANGLNVGLRHQLGIERVVTSPCHSITVGFDLRRRDGQPFPFGSLTYYGESTAARMAYLTLFPIRDTMRANLMVYRTMDDPWLREMRHAPEQALHQLMPNLRKLTGDVVVDGPIRIRPADLYVTQGHRQAGIVLVGDAFATSCPAAGTGTRKVFTDVEQLCNVHIPKWLASNGMDAAKIGQFYDDPVKQACDAASSTFAYQLRAISIENGFVWHLRRWVRFLARAGIGGLRELRSLLAAQPLQQRPGV